MLLEAPTVPLTHAVTFEALYWPAAHSADAPFADAHAHTSDGVIPLSGIKLDGEHPLSEVTLVDSIRWEQVIAAAVVHMPNRWETLLVVGEIDGATVAVSVPTAALTGEGTAPELGQYLAHELQILIGSARMSTVGDNLDELLAGAVAPPVTLAPQPDQSQERPEAVIRLGQRGSIFARR